jgi:hypothetical protein
VRDARSERRRDAGTKITAPVRFFLKIFERDGNADEIWVFVASSFLLAKSKGAAHASFALAFAAANTPGATAFAARKKLCTGRLCGRADGSGEAQNARIGANRFATASSVANASGVRRRRGAGNFRFRLRIAVRWGAGAAAAKSRRGMSCSAADLALEKIVDRLRIGLAARRFHHLADEPADRFRV